MGFLEDMFGRQSLVRTIQAGPPALCLPCAKRDHDMCDTESMMPPCDCYQRGHTLVDKIRELFCESVIRIPIPPDPVAVAEVELTAAMSESEFLELRCGRGKHYTGEETTASYRPFSFFDDAPKHPWPILDPAKTDYQSIMIGTMYKHSFRPKESPLREVPTDPLPEHWHRYHDPMGRTHRWPPRLGTIKPLTGEDIMRFVEEYE